MMIRQENISEIFEKADRQIVAEAEALKHATHKLRFEGRLHLKRNAAKALTALAILKERLLSHADEEEEVLLPFIASRLPELRAVQAIFFDEHKEFREVIREIGVKLKKLRAGTHSSLNGLLIHDVYSKSNYLVCLVISHMNYENKQLYQLLEKGLEENDKSKLIHLMILGS